jgi:flagellar hook-associated protein 2
VTRASSSSVDGTHAVSVTQAATKASVTGSGYSLSGTDITFDVTVGSTTASVLIPSGSDIEAAVGAINSALGDAGLNTVTASHAGGAISLVSTRFGSNGSFTIAGDPWGMDGTYTGLDVAGTIGGVAGTGSGRTLSGTGAFDGLLVSISASSDEVFNAGGTLALGNVTVRSGLASNFDQFLGTVLGSGGLIDRATDRWDAQIRLADDRIQQLEARLVRKEVALRRQFTALETSLARLSSLSSGLLAGLNTQQQR